MKLSNVISQFGLENMPEEWPARWEASLSGYPGENNIRFIQKDYLHEANDVLKLSGGALQALLEAAEAVAKNEALCMLVWHCANMLHGAYETAGLPEFRFPVSGRLTGEFNGLINVLILLSGLDSALKEHRKRGVPPEVTADTFSDLMLWMDHYRRKYGKWGMEKQAWLINHFSCRLYRLGRLQYIHRPFYGDIKVFRRRGDRRVLALSEAGITYREDGQVDGTNGIFDKTGPWTSCFSADGRQITSNPISPFGCAVKDTVRLDAAEWDLVLAKGSPVLDMHIPEGGKMSPELCGQSLHMAEEFYRTLFPEKDYHAFTCHTWLFDSQFQELLPPESNIVRFQRNFYLYPALGSDFQTFERVFGEKPGDLSKAPRDTALRRAILDFAAQGNHMRDAGGFILPEDLDWGGDPYQRDRLELIE